MTVISYVTVGLMRNQEDTDSSTQAIKEPNPLPGQPCQCGWQEIHMAAFYPVDGTDMNHTACPVEETNTKRLK